MLLPQESWVKICNGDIKYGKIQLKYRLLLVTRQRRMWMPLRTKFPQMCLIAQKIVLNFYEMAN